MRLTIHEDKDPVVQGFFAAQPARGYSDAVRLLIHMFVSEYGNRDVVGAFGERLVSLRPHQTANAIVPRPVPSADQPELPFEQDITPVPAEAGAPESVSTSSEPHDDDNDDASTSTSEHQPYEMGDVFESLRPSH